MDMHLPNLPVVRIRFQNTGASARTLRYLNIGTLVIAIVSAFPMHCAWRLSRQDPETRMGNATVSRAANPQPVTCDAAAVGIDRLSTDFAIVLLTPAYAEKFDDLQQLEQLSVSNASSIETKLAATRSLERAKEFLNLSRQDPMTIDVHRLAQAHAELNLALADLSAELRRRCI